MSVRWSYDVNRERDARHYRACDDSGYFVTVRWSGRIGPQGQESTHRPDDLARATDWVETPS